MSDQETWAAVDSYFEGLFIPPDPALDEAIKDTAGTSMPLASVSPSQGRLLHILALAVGARSILEIGTLGGYSTIWLARALPPDGRLISLEIDPGNAVVARSNIERAGMFNKVEIRIGAAITTLPQLVDSGAGPFDLVFIDADKASTPDYLAWSLRLTKPGSLVIIDNIVRGGKIADPASDDQNVQGIRRALGMLATDPHFAGAAVQTVGSKSYDGFAIAVVTAG